MIMDSATYRRLLAKAHAEGIVIVGFAASAAGYVFVVENPAHDGEYVIRFPAGAHTGSCSCPAGVHGLPCKHAALALELLRAAEAEENEMAALRSTPYEQDNLWN